MPTRTTKGVLGKSHIRASSASSTGKLNINTTFLRNKSSDKIKRNTSDVQQRNTSPYPHPPQIRGNLSPTKRIVLLPVETGGDDDEWVSSESGAVTPAECDEEDVPPGAEEPVNRDDLEPIPSTTPRGDVPTLPLVPPHKLSPAPQSRADLPRVDTASRFTTQAEDSPSSDSVGHGPSTPTRLTSHRRSATRPPSMRSVQSSLPHPLIRARSYAPSTPVVTAPPALSSGMAEVFPGSNIPSPNSSPPKDPSSAITSSPSSEDHHAHYHHRLKRQGSYSSVTSVATLPLPTTTSAATASTTRVHGERQRTLSHASTSAALSSLTAARHSHAPSRPSSPVLTIAFPPINPRGEHVHVMIPPPLVFTHVSATAHQNPILEALRRVTEAKTRAGR